MTTPRKWFFLCENESLYALVSVYESFANGWDSMEECIEKDCHHGKGSPILMSERVFKRIKRECSMGGRK
jgi:hypothetical protein